jgi:hypothetical protein
MASNEIPSVTKVSGRSGSASLPQPGQLDRFEEGTWEFTGNGSASTRDVAQSILNYEASQSADPAVKAAAQRLNSDPHGVEFLASELLDENPGIKDSVGGDPDKAIPKGSTLKSDGPTLKEALGFLARNMDMLKSALQNQQHQRDNRYGVVPNNSLELPVDDY